MSDLCTFVQYELSDLSKSLSSLQGIPHYRSKRSTDHSSTIDSDPTSMLCTEGTSKRLFNKFVIKSAPWKHRQIRRRDKISLIEKASSSIAQSILDLQEADVIAVDLPVAIIDQFIGIGSSMSDEAILNTFKNLTSNHKQCVFSRLLFFLVH